MYTTEKIGSKIIVNVPGDLDTSGKAEELKGILEQLYQEGEREFILNIDNTRMINGDSVGKIVLFNKKLKGDGGYIFSLLPMMH